MKINLPTYLPTHLPAYAPTHLRTYLPTYHAPIYLPVWIFIYPSIHRYIMSLYHTRLAAAGGMAKNKQNDQKELRKSRLTSQ